MVDAEYLAKKEFDGKLYKEISPEFTDNTTQITHTIPDGKTFYFVGAKLYPVNNIIVGEHDAINVNRHTNIEISLDQDIVEVLTYDYHFEGSRMSRASAFGTGQYDTLLLDSIDGDGTKAIQVTSSNTNGTYRVSLIGFEEDTGVDPSTQSIEVVTVNSNTSDGLSDIGFIREKVLEGNWIQITGNIDALADTITYNPELGKTFFLYEAKISMRVNTLTPCNNFTGDFLSNDQTVAELKIDDTTVDTAKIGFSTGYGISSGEGGGAGMGLQSDAFFIAKGKSLVGDNTKTISIENISSNGSCIATLTGWIEDTIVLK